MARAFSERGVPAVAVYSQSLAEESFRVDRQTAIEMLKREKIRVIFSVDMFNEGVDITSVDMVMFLRPTESPVVFLQQLGRGLRRDQGKEYLQVLDFIGNYEKAGNVRRYLLSGIGAGTNANEETSTMAELAGGTGRTNALPDDCIVDFDMRLIDLFREMDKKQLRLRDRIAGEYRKVKEQLGRRPMRMDLFTYMEEETYQLALNHTKDNLFKHYLEYVKGQGDLLPQEEKLFDGIGREFMNVLETTSMSRVYKMPVLMAFYNHGQIRMEVTEAELLTSWKEFFNTGTNWKDLDKGMTFKQYQAISDREHIRKILQMPVHFLQESGKGFFVKREGSALALCEELREIVRDEAFIRHFKDAVDLRVMDYYKRRYAEGK